MEVILLLYVREEDYGHRLLRFLLAKKNRFLHPELVTDEKMLWNRVGTQAQRIVVLTDREMMVKEEKREIIYLSAQRGNERKSVYQYQKAESLYRELLVKLGIEEGKTDEPLSDSAAHSGGIWFFISTDGIGLTAAAVMAAQYLALHGKCLYINLTEFPVWFGETLCEKPNFQLAGAGELLFMSEDREFIRREKEVRKELGKAYLLPPFHHYKDLLDSTKEDWQEMFHRLRSDCGYDSIVVELGSLTEHTLDLLSLGDKILLFNQKGMLGDIRFHVWEQYCRMEKSEELLRQIQRCAIPDEWQEWETMMIDELWEEMAENKQFMSKIEAILYQKQEEEEDVYCLEGFEGET